MAIELFNFQYLNNPVYRQYTDIINVKPGEVTGIDKIPFLPIQFFKTHEIKTTGFEAERIFESSGTTQNTKSKHFVKSEDLYRKSFTTAFELFYGPVKEWCIIGLLPSYLERNDSSLVTMVDELIKKSGHPQSGFYLEDHDKLHQALLHNEILKKPTLLIGVTFALLEFAEKYKMRLSSTVIMETGGMKGKREEITREEVHHLLQKKLGPSEIHSEYGMTELLSQAYSRGKGLFKCPPWMKVLIRDKDDPLTMKPLTPRWWKNDTGIMNVIDLANIFSCAFIATEDIGRLSYSGCFEVLGRCDNSEIRGCSMLTLN